MEPGRAERDALEARLSGGAPPGRPLSGRCGISEREEMDLCGSAEQPAGGQRHARARVSAPGRAASSPPKDMISRLFPVHRASTAPVSRASNRPSRAQSRQDPPRLSTPPTTGAADDSDAPVAATLRARSFQVRLGP